VRARAWGSVAVCRSHLLARRNTVPLQQAHDHPHRNVAHQCLTVVTVTHGIVLCWESSEAA